MDGDLDRYQDTRGTWIIERRRLRCPKCGSVKTKPQSGARPNGDGTATQPRLCLTCAARFKVVLI